MSTEIEQLFGGSNSEEQNALLHVIKERGYEFFEKTPKTTMTIRLLEDLHKLGYKLVKNDDLLHDVSQQRELLESFIEWHNYKSSHHRHLYKSDVEEYLDDLNESNCG